MSASTLIATRGSVRHTTTHSVVDVCSRFHPEVTVLQHVIGREGMPMGAGRRSAEQRTAAGYATGSPSSSVLTSLPELRCDGLVEGQGLQDLESPGKQL